MTMSSRDQRIDFWRGLCLLGMVSWHLLTHPSFPRPLAFAVIQPFNFVAEGFVLLAGAAIGLKIARKRFVSSALLRRAGSLLALHYALVAFVLVLAVIERKLGLAVQLSAFPRNVGDVITLSYQPYLADVLSVFVFLFLAAPLFYFVYSSLGAIGLVVASAVIFATASLFPINTGGAFDFNSWQVVFVAGILFGANYESILASWKTHSARLLTIFVVVFAAAFLVRAFIAGPDGAHLPGWRGYLAFSRKPLSIARMVYIAAEMAMIALLTVRWWDSICNSFIVARIVALGRSSLEVFACSVVLDYLLKAVCTDLKLMFPVNLIAWGIEVMVLVALADALNGRVSRTPVRAVTASEFAVN